VANSQTANRKTANRKTGSAKADRSRQTAAIGMPATAAVGG
jgi:hypothetical protein